MVRMCVVFSVVLYTEELRMYGTAERNISNDGDERIDFLIQGRLKADVLLLLLARKCTLEKINMMLLAQLQLDLGSTVDLGSFGGKAVFWILDLGSSRWFRCCVGRGW
jgi:hypothetical protein